MRRSGYEIVGEIGVPAIREKSVRQTTRLIELADEAGFGVNTCRNPEQRGGVVVIDVPNGREVTQELARRQILVDYRPQAGIRVAPHFYTTDDEIERTVSEDSRHRAMRRERLLVGIVWLAFVLRGAYYCVQLPMWEGLDEWAHFAALQYFAEHGQMPARTDLVSDEVVRSLELTPCPGPTTGGSRAA
jgi:hypothetical protein